MVVVTALGQSPQTKPREHHYALCLFRFRPGAFGFPARGGSDTANHYTPIRAFLEPTRRRGQATRRSQFLAKSVDV